MGDGDLEGIVCNRLHKISPQMETKFESEELKIKHLCRERAEKLLANNSNLVHKFAQTILEKETLDEKEIYELYNASKNL